MEDATAAISQAPTRARHMLFRDGEIGHRNVKTRVVAVYVHPHAHAKHVGRFCGCCCAVQSMRRYGSTITMRHLYAHSAFRESEYHATPTLPLVRNDRQENIAASAEVPGSRR